MNVIQMSARDVNLTSRQATNTAATSQLALLDGRSIYLDFFGLILWDFVPTNTSDIKQIEVVRGPASAVWGANALTGVVNIITKSPRQAAGTTTERSVADGSIVTPARVSAKGRERSTAPTSAHRRWPMTDGRIASALAISIPIRCHFRRPIGFNIGGAYNAERLFGWLSVSLYGRRVLERRTHARISRSH